MATIKQPIRRSTDTVTATAVYGGTNAQNRLSRIWRWPSWTLALPAGIAVLILLPIAGLTLTLLQPDLALWERLWATILPPMLRNTLVLVGGVGIGTLVIGTGFAWLTSAYEFPGRGVFDRLLLLPLAVPTFVMGFVFMAIFDYVGPVQTALRTHFGEHASLPPIRSLGGAVLVMTLVLYPYVYLLARAAFREQAASTFEAARVMGLSRTQTFLRLVLPLARPSLAAGVFLAMMEALTDYGTVSFFSVPTLSEAVVRLWGWGSGTPQAVELASMLLVFAVLMLVMERALRGRAKYYQVGGGSKGRRMNRHRLSGWKAALAALASVVLLFVAFVLPMLQLTSWTIQELRGFTTTAWQSRFFEYVGNTSTLAATAAALVVVLAIFVAHGVRATAHDGRFSRVARIIARLLTTGYALPGAVVAAGVLMFLSPLDFAINDLAASLGLDKPGLILTGTMTGLVYAYLVRFMAVGYNSIESSLEKITPNMEQAARCLGATPGRVLWRIHIPLLSTGIAAGALLVFVDVMKELPATLLLRPFGMDTLAIWAYIAAFESLWMEAALPALSIVLVGLIPVFLLMRIGDRMPAT